MVDEVGVAVGVYNGEYLDAHAAGFGDADVLLGDVHDEHGVRGSRHVPYPEEVLFELGKSLFKFDRFLLGQGAEEPLFPLLLEFLHVV